MSGMLRFKYWVIELVSSLVVALSFIAYSRMELDAELSRNDGWGFYVSLASIVLSLSGILASAVFPQSELAGSICRVESILVWVTVGMWSIASITSIVGTYQEDSSVIDESYIVVHPNLYFFSLCCLITSILLIASWFQENVHSGASLTTTQWILLGSMSFFVMISGIAFRETAGSSFVATEDTSFSSNKNTTATIIPLCDTENYNCDRVNLAVILGAISAAVACFVIPWKAANLKCQGDISAMLFTAWLVSIWYLTFDSGPGTSFGNLYFGTWTAFYLTLNILILSSTMDETTMILANSRGSSRIDRDDVWEEAYERLDMLTPRQSHSGNRMESYGDMFSPAEEWPGMDLFDFNDDGGERDRGTALTKDAKVRSHQVRRLEMWSILGIASAVNLSAMIQTLEQIGGETADRFILSVPATSLVFAVCGFSTCMRDSSFANKIQAATVRT
jgi:hypothetical protein